MSELDDAVTENRARVEDFIAALEPTRARWQEPVRPGKWSPAQLAEHITLSYRQAAALAGGDPSGFPRAPWLLRPLIGTFFRRIVRTGTFPRSRTFRSLTPLDAPADPAAAAARIRAALAACEAGIRAAGATLAHPAFGTIGAADYVRFLGHHTRHHQRQLNP